MRSFCVFIIFVLLTACGSSRGPTTKYYKLDIPSAPAAAGPSAPASLRIENFRATDMLRQDRIVYRPSPEEVGFYEYHRWAEPPKDAVTKALADQLVKRHAFQSVEVSDGSDKTDYVLTGSIERLQEMDYAGAVRAQVIIAAELRDPARQKIIWSSSASSESAVTKRDVDAVVAAMGRASQQSISRLMTDLDKFVQRSLLESVSSAKNQRP